MNLEQEEILVRLGELWSLHPHLRLGQLIGNVFPIGSGTDPYYLDDEVLLDRMEKHYNPVDNPLDEHLTKN